MQLCIISEEFEDDCFIFLWLLFLDHFNLIVLVLSFSTSVSKLLFYYTYFRFWLCCKQVKLNIPSEVKPKRENTINIEPHER